MAKTVTIIIPFYNTEVYARACLDSVVSQTYPELQIILVDDGSPDHCGEICDEYAAKDSRILVIHQENGGLSDARNTGIARAEGDFITFVDSDDIIDRRYVEILVKAQEQYDADVVQGSYTYYVKELGGCDPNAKPVVIADSGDEALRSLLRRREASEAACAKLYSRHLFETYRFPKGRINEDTLTTYKYLYLSRKAVFLSDYIYYYRFNNNGILHSRFSEKRFDFLTVFDEMDDFLGDRREDFRDDLLYYRIRRTLFFYNQAVALGADKEFKDRLKAVRRQILSYKDGFGLLNLKYRGLVRLLRLCPPLYHTMVRRVRKKEREYEDALAAQ